MLTSESRINTGFAGSLLLGLMKKDGNAGDWRSSPTAFVQLRYKNMETSLIIGNCLMQLRQLPTTILEKKYGL